MKRTTLLSAVFLTLSLAVTSGVLGQSSEQIETSKASSAEEEGIKGVGKRSRFTRLVSAEQLERAGAQQFNEMKRQAARKQAQGVGTTNETREPVQRQHAEGRLREASRAPRRPR